MNTQTFTQADITAIEVEALRKRTKEQDRVLKVIKLAFADAIIDMNSQDGLEMLQELLKSIICEIEHP